MELGGEEEIENLNTNYGYIHKSPGLKDHISWQQSGEDIYPVKKIIVTCF
jgi:hypothetical protein